MEIKNPKVSAYKKRFTSKDRVAPEGLAILRATRQENRKIGIDFASDQRARGESRKEDYVRANS